MSSPNEGFIFDGIGAFMSEFVPYGGVIYAHNKTSTPRSIPRNARRKHKEVAVFLVGGVLGGALKNSTHMM